MIKISIFNKNDYRILFVLLCAIFALQSIRAQQIENFIVQHAGTLALGATAVYAGLWWSDCEHKLNALISLKDYMLMQNRQCKLNSQELSRGIFIYGSSADKLETAKAFATVLQPTIVLSAKDLQDSDVSGLFKAVTLCSSFFSWCGYPNPCIPIIIHSIDTFKSRQRIHGNTTLSNLLKEIENNPQVTVIGIIDNLSNVDPSLIRPGRLDHHICLNSEEIQTRDIERYIKGDITGDKTDYSINSCVSAIGIEKALKEMGFDVTINTMDIVFKKAALSADRRKSPFDSNSSPNLKTNKIISQDVVNALIDVELRERLDVQGISFKSILNKVLSLTNWTMNSSAIYNIRFFLSLMTKERLIILLTQLNQDENVEMRRELLLQYITKNISESLLKVVAMCQHVYNISEVELFEDSLKKWLEHINKSYVGDYFKNDPSSYFYKTIIPEALKICEENKNPVSLMPVQSEAQKIPGDQKSTFLSKINFSSTYSRLSLLLSCSALFLWCKWFFASDGY